MFREYFCPMGKSFGCVEKCFGLMGMALSVKIRRVAWYIIIHQARCTHLHKIFQLSIVIFELNILSRKSNK